MTLDPVPEFQGRVSRHQKSRRILILNWRDITHPRAGGAEKVTHEIARRWVSWGHLITQFSAAYPGAQADDVIDGVRVIRRGRQYTVHWEAFRYFRRLPRGCFDAVIDEVNTIPFFTPLYLRLPVIMFINQLARDVWHYEAPFPLNAVGFAAEPNYLQAYRRTPIVTISESTKLDLRKLGLRGPCVVIPMAVDTNAPVSLPSLGTKEPRLTLAYVGRVVPSKRVDHIISALSLIHKSGETDARLWIIGSCGESYRHRLESDITMLGLRGYVTFFGQVDATTKEQLLARAHMLVMTSVREGWGLVVTEASALGTPSVVYDVPGLRDSTHRGKTGVVCKSNTPAALARDVMSLFHAPALYSRLRERGWGEAKALNWDRTARVAWEAVEASL